MAWIGNVLILVSIWRLGNKHRDAWWWSVAGNVFWTVFGITEGIWSIVFIDSVMIVIAVRNWSKWK